MITLYNEDMKNLTEDDIMLIRERYVVEKEGIVSIAKSHNVSSLTISGLVSERGWIKERMALQYGVEVPDTYQQHVQLLSKILYDKIIDPEGETSKSVSELTRGINTYLELNQKVAGLNSSSRTSREEIINSTRSGLAEAKTREEAIRDAKRDSS